MVPLTIAESTNWFPLKFLSPVQKKDGVFPLLLLNQDVGFILLHLHDRSSFLPSSLPPVLDEDYIILISSEKLGVAAVVPPEELNRAQAHQESMSPSQQTACEQSVSKQVFYMTLIKRHQSLMPVDTTIADYVDEDLMVKEGKSISNIELEFCKDHEVELQKSSKSMFVAGKEKDACPPCLEGSMLLAEWL
ncbi:hypothetical protein Nepgr_031593 [Nepenthes gracilis]|uniref:Uncharacterized protein n=1 Tax=Nepenthes gracilis TaxID=150966 RepID=A0AAD3TH05_NEPGR|nr:hypothetical protein Nepgr_031593 [Nepenthes gracilis]